MREHVLCERYPDRTADVACDIGQRGSLIGLVGREAVIGRRHDRNEEERQPDADVDARPGEIPEIEISIEACQTVHRNAMMVAPVAIRYFGCTCPPDSRPTTNIIPLGNEAAGREGAACPGGRVSEDILQELGHD